MLALVYRIFRSIAWLVDRLIDRGDLIICLQVWELSTLWRATVLSGSGRLASPWKSAFRLGESIHFAFLENQDSHLKCSKTLLSPSVLQVQVDVAISHFCITFAAHVLADFWKSSFRLGESIHFVFSASRETCFGPPWRPRPLGSFFAFILGPLEAPLGPPWGTKTLQNQTAAAVGCF